MITIKAMDEVREFDNDPEKVGEMMDTIMLLVEADNLVVDHLLVDGVPVMNNHRQYIKEHIDEIREIEAIPAGKIDLALDNIEQIADGMEPFLPMMDILAEDFRQGVSERGWNEFENLINTMIQVDGWLKETFMMVLDADDNSYNTKFDRIRNEYMKLYSVLHDIEDALNFDDPVKAGNLIENKVKKHIAETCSRIRETLAFAAERQGEKNGQ
ncbi:MAG: hypothetical protein IKT15_03800 [Firmicutes bacterium]|nr:hypothetical protein [Bacillota bacterium]MBR6504075.1 hypothetical protein [Bacillota bacterium]